MVERRREPGDCGMAVLADVAGRDMRRMLAGGRHTDMTGTTVAGDPGMVERRREPGDRGMAVVAGITAGDMGRVFADGGDTVMAGATGAEHLRVINSIGRRPQGVAMAVLADVGCTDMRQVLTGRLSAIMTRRTVAGDAGVIERRREPGSRRVTVIAGITAGDVGRVFADGGDTIMAGATGAEHLRVIDECH
jgi:hypothetical protein